MGGSWQAVGLFGQNCAILPQTILPDRIRSRLFAPWRTVYISPQSNGIWRQKRDEGILVNRSRTLDFLLNFKEGKNAISYLLTGICGRLQWWTSLASFLMFTGVGTHEPAGQNSTQAEQCGIWGAAVNTWFGDLCGFGRVCIPGWYLWLYFASQQAGGGRLLETWNFIQPLLDGSRYLGGQHWGYKIYM